MSSLLQSPKVSMHFIVSVIISGDSASYMLEMVIVISLEDTLTQTRIGVGRVTLPCKGHMKDPNISTFGKNETSFYKVTFFQLIFLETLSLFP